MMFKNSVKLLCANFDKVWKLLVYHILSIGLCIGLICVFYNYYIDAGTIALNESSLKTFTLTGTFYGSTLADGLTAVADFVIIFFREIFSNVGIGIYFVIIAFILLPLLLNVGKIVTCEMMYGYMSSCQKQSFTGTYLKMLRSSFSYAIVKVFYSMPFNALIVLSMWALTRVDNEIFDYIMPFAFVIVPALFMAFKETFNAGWAPAKVVYNQNVFKSFNIGMRAVLRRGARVFSTSFVIFLLAIVLSMVIGVYAIIIILPLISPLIHIFEMVMFFSSQGMRFYVDNDTILSPKRLEEIDRIEDAKFIL